MRHGIAFLYVSARSAAMPCRLVRLVILVSVIGLMNLLGLYAVAEQDRSSPGSISSQSAQQAIAGDDGWRRTSQGWEHVDTWKDLRASEPVLIEKLSYRTFFKRTWPATLATSQLLLILSLLSMMRSTDDSKTTAQAR